MRNVKILKAAYKGDLPKILEDLGIKKDFEDGRIYCKKCGLTISYANLGLIIPGSGELEFVCNSAECIENKNVSRKEN